MINFGLSAYIRILSLTPRAQESALKQRIAPSGGGYDFHKAMRKIAVPFVTGKIDIHEVRELLSAITKSPERRSAATATNNLIKWSEGEKIEVASEDAARWISPSGVFSVKFTPDFELVGAKKNTLVHLWNTKSVDLTARTALASLAAFAQYYDNHDLAVLCLRTKKLHRLEDLESAQKIANFYALHLDQKINELLNDHEGGVGTKYKIG